MIIFLFLALNCYTQPYGGTIFVDADILEGSDSSSFESLTYVGRGQRTVFDRRVNNWVSVDAYLFNVVWNDGLTSEAVINPEFESVESAQKEAEKYGWYIGQLPHCLRTDVEEIWINKGVELFGGGNKSILIHTGQTVLYENDGILEETLIHEAAHTSLDATHAQSEGWLEAQRQDGAFISDYAEEFPDREDIAESFLLWLAVRYRKEKLSTEDIEKISQTIPNRLAYFDSISCDLFPFYSDNVTAVNQFIKEEDIAFYPNPVTDILFLKLKNYHSYHATVYNATGKAVLNRNLNGEQQLTLSGLPKGFYVLQLYRDGQFIRKKFLKL